MYILFDSITLLIISFFIGFILTVVLFCITLGFSTKSFHVEKNNPYECGFQPFEDSRNKIEVKYYLVAILYIIFDLEIMFLLPWIVYKFQCSLLEMIIFCFFFIILLVGFIYEWLKGALKWS